MIRTDIAAGTHALDGRLHFKRSNLRILILKIGSFGQYRDILKLLLLAVSFRELFKYFGFLVFKAHKHCAVRFLVLRRALFVDGTIPVSIAGGPSFLSFGSGIFFDDF